MCFDSLGAKKVYGNFEPKNSSHCLQIHMAFEMEFNFETGYRGLKRSKYGLQFSNQVAKFVKKRYFNSQELKFSEIFT